MQLILLLLIFCATCYASKESGYLLETQNEYAFYYPLAMNSKESARVCLEINKKLLPVTVKTAFTNKTCEDDTCKTQDINSEFSCWNIKAPEQGENFYEPLHLQLEIENKNKGIEFKGQNRVQVNNKQNRIFIETDRKVYKMGDTVKIRLLVLNFELKPVKNYKIPSIVIRSPYPSSALVKEWENVTVKTGLTQFEFQLASDVPEGTWSISGHGVYGWFEVKKYVLPRFQASISGPDRMYNGTKGTSYSICATYSYGRKVKGVALLLAKANLGYLKDPLTHSEVKNLQAGCAEFEIRSEDLQLQNTSIWSIELTATVTEDGTDQTESDNKYVYVSRDPYSYRWDDVDQYIKPELPYKSRFWLTDVQVPLPTRLVEICYKTVRGDNFGCGNFTMNSDYSVEFTIPPIKNMSAPQNIEVEATVIDHKLTYTPKKYLTLWISSNKNAIKILRKTQDSVECGATLKFTVLYNSKDLSEKPGVHFKYLLTSRSEIVDAGSLIENPKKKILNLSEYPNAIGLEDYGDEDSKIVVDEFELEIKLVKKVYTKSKLVVYYDLDNEVVADIVDIEVDTCSPNKVNAKWQESPLYPGEIGTLNIKTGSESFCSVSSIDKASKFLGSSERINLDSVLNMLSSYPYFFEENCIKLNNTNNTENENMRIWRRFGSSFFDAIEAFTHVNLGVISNMKFISKTCEERPMLIPFALAGVAEKVDSVAAPAPSSAAGGVTDNRGSAIRSFFPETWLWDLVLVGEDGQIALEKKLPDSITDWVGNVLCVSSADGFGISGEIEMRGFKPFFVDVLLPYSIKRNKEILHLPIPIFNYLNNSLPIRVTLTTSDDIVLVDGEDKATFTKCLGPQDSYTHHYRIKATKLGLINITVSANADPANVENCASDSIIRRNDVVRKQILVEPEGYPSGMIRSALLCANDSLGVNSVHWNIYLPENVVQDTVNGRVIINSDILGPVFQNLENILVVPTGCGEQTMATLTPNLYVLKYLKANNALTERIHAKILKNLETGYQRMLNYVHDDGSFSAFGKSDKEGSMFLTAFVVRTFKQMKEYTFIDDDVINKAIKWIILHQLENGCFDPVKHVFHEMGLASSKNQTTALTSYTLISFLETNTSIDEKIISNAKKCILDDKTTDKYTNAISSYALGLMNLNEEVKNKLDYLIKVADRKDDLIWWTQSETSSSINVEVSSYVLKSLLLQDPVENLGTASSIVRWLQTQMNPRGAFYSTQDTVVGLDSISSYATLVNKKEPNVKIAIETKAGTKDLEIVKREYSKPEIIPLLSYPNEVKANIQGDGCVSIQATVSYYLDVPFTNDDLKLDVSLKAVSEKSKCSFVELKPCVSYTALGKINMAIVEVSIPSGFAPDQASLYELTSNSESGIKKFEQIRNQVVFYLIELGANQVCMPFKIEENIIVENVANATVKLYDYYKPEVFIFKSFKVEDCQGTAKV